MSAMLVSLLPTKSFQGDSGSSCTWVVQEFGYLFPGQRQPYEAHVHFFSQEERHAIIKAYVADYYRVSQQDDEVTNGKKDPAQVVEDDRARRTVVTAFRSMFIGQPEFATNKTAHDFLASADSEDDEYITGPLCEWSDALMDSVLEGREYLVSEAPTSQALNRELQSFTHSVELGDGEPLGSFWPLVSYIRFGLDVPLLKHNITLVDLPGLSDADKTRANNAMKHQYECTHYMVVAQIGRATDDKSVRDSLQRGARAKGDGMTTLVLTHADEIDDGTEVRGSREDEEKLGSLEDSIEALEEKQQTLAGKIKKLKRKSAAYNDARDEADLVNDKLRAENARKKALRIKIRSEMVTRKMRELYTDLAMDVGTTLPVYCVGNAAYSKHLKGYHKRDSPNPPHLTIEETKIPALRKHLFLTPADGKLNQLHHMVDRQLQTIFKFFELYVSKTHMARKDEIEAIVVGPQDSAPNAVCRFFCQLHTQIDQEILAKIKDQELDWTDEAGELCQEWAKVGSRKHLELLKKDGRKEGRGRTSGVSWNAELVSLRSGEVRGFFDELWRNTLTQAPKLVTRDMQRLISDMVRKISGTFGICLDVL